MFIISRLTLCQPSSKDLPVFAGRPEVGKEPRWISCRNASCRTRKERRMLWFRQSERLMV